MAAHPVDQQIVNLVIGSSFELSLYPAAMRYLSDTVTRFD